MHTKDSQYARMAYIYWILCHQYHLRFHIPGNISVALTQWIHVAAPEIIIFGFDLQAGWKQDLNHSQGWKTAARHQATHRNGNLAILTHLFLDKITVISQRIFSDAFSWMKSFVFWLQFHWSLFWRVQLKITSTGLSNGLAPNRRQAIIWTKLTLLTDAYIRH